MGKLNPEKFSQRLQDLNRYLDFIPIEKTSDSLKITKAYGKYAKRWDKIHHETCNPTWMDSQSVVTWKRTLEIQISRWSAQCVPPTVAGGSAKANHFPNGWKAFKQVKWRKEKKIDKNHHNSNGGRGSNRHGNTARGGRGGRGRGRSGRGGRGNNSEHLQSVECLNCGKKGHYSTDCSLPKKNNEISNIVSKDYFKNLFQPLMKEMFTKKDKKAKNNADGDDDSLDMNVFEKLMEGKQPMFVNKSNDDLIIINTLTLLIIICRIKILTKVLNIISIVMIMMN
jgi:hypothetical protein